MKLEVTTKPVPFDHSKLKPGDRFLYDGGLRIVYNTGGGLLCTLDQNMHHVGVLDAYEGADCTPCGPSGNPLQGERELKLVMNEAEAQRIRRRELTELLDILDKEL